jgi:hypothetical protein
MAQSTGLSRRGFLAAAAAASATPVIARAVTASADPASAVVKASSLHPTLDGDNTAVLQAALDSDASTVIIDKIPGNWSTRPLFLRRSNVRVIFEPGVMVRATGSGYGTNDCLLTVADQSNVTISGYGATLAMNKWDYTTGEWRMALSLLSVKDTVVEGLVLRDSGGDGIYLGRGSTPYCENVTIRDVVCDNNRRNGMSVITADGLTVEGCAFLNTNGTNPQAGVDCEPNSASERLSNVVFSDCIFEGNLKAGFICQPSQFNAGSAPISITIDRTTIGRQITGDPSVQLIPYKTLAGSIELRDSLLNVGAGSGGYAVFYNSPDGLQNTVRRCTVWDQGNSYISYGPLTIVSGANGSDSFANYGRVDFDDCVVVTDFATPFFTATGRGPSSALTDVHGTITAVNPYGVAADFGSEPTDVDVTVRVEKPGVNAPVRVRAGRGQVRGGETARFIFTRLGGDLSTPLAIVYTTSGVARERYDYGGLGKVAVIAPGQREVAVDVRTFPRRLDTDPERRNLVVAIAPGPRYEPAPRPATAEVVIA